jgi:hydroxymethylbilane synthase
MTTSLRIATRKSPLAMWQANYIRDSIIYHNPQVEVELLALLTKADKLLATPLNKIGGKALFVKELEMAILEHQADIAVHSIKDLPGELPDGLILTAICKREDPRDVLICSHHKSFSALPSGSVIGTSSLRRSAQVLALRPDLKILPLRGNVGTRLEKLDEGEFDAIILAAAGLKRLELTHRITEYFSTDQILPAAGQGAIGIEGRHNDHQHFTLVNFLDHYVTRQEILAERAVTGQLGGSCQFPIAAHAQTEHEQLKLKALVADPNGQTLIRTEKMGPHEFAEEIGFEAAEDLISQGALELLAKIQSDNLSDQ